MILEGMFYEQVMTQPEIRVYPQYPTIPAGDVLGTQAIYRYGLRESTYPTLSLVEPLYDKSGNFIPPGHYELALSDERQFLILLEAKKPLAVIPVFKVEVSMSEKPQINSSKALRKKNKEQKEIIKTNKKRAKIGMPPVDTEEAIYQEASIEYIKDGDYYLIRYERDDVKAWAAIKR